MQHTVTSEMLESMADKYYKERDDKYARFKVVVCRNWAFKQYAKKEFTMNNLF